MRPWLCHESADPKACYLTGLGSPQVPEARLFPCKPGGFAHRPSTESRTNRLHTPIRRTPLQSSFNSVAAPPFRGKQLPAWVSALTRHHGRASTSREASHASLRSILRLSQPLDGLRRATALRVYFIPQPGSGPLSRSGVYPLRTGFLPRRQDSTSLPLGPTNSPASGLPFPDPPTSRLYSMRSRKPRTPGLARAHGRAPLRVRLPLQVISPPLPPVTRLQSLMTFRGPTPPAPEGTNRGGRPSPPAS